MKINKKLVIFSLSLILALTGGTISFAEDTNKDILKNNKLGKPKIEINENTKYINGIPIYEEFEDVPVEEERVTKNIDKKDINESFVTIGDDIYPLDKWFKQETTEYYTSNNKYKFQVETMIPFLYTLDCSTTISTGMSGSTKFGFEELDEVSMILNKDELKSKHISLTMEKEDINRDTTYYLEKVCKVKKTHWQYLKSPWIGNNYHIYNSYTYDSAGTVYWFWAE